MTRERCTHVLTGGKGLCARPKGHAKPHASEAALRVQEEARRAWREKNPERSRNRQTLEERRRTYLRRKTDKYVYAILCDGVLKIGFSCTRGQLTVTRSSAKRLGFDFANAEMIWQMAGDETLELFLQAYATRIWKPARPYSGRASEWFLVPGLGAEDIAMKLKEWHTIYEDLKPYHEARG